MKLDMHSLGSVVEKVRSKNAGPFIITIDIFCNREEIYRKIEASLNKKFLSKYLNVKEGSIKIYLIDNLKVLKVSVDRLFIQGSRFDRDIHGAQLANLISELMIE